MFTLLIAIILVMFFSLLMLADDNNLDPNRKNIKNLNQDETKLNTEKAAPLLK